MSICLCSSYGRPNERKGRINNLDSGLWFTAPFHYLHARRHRRRRSIHLPSRLELDRFAQCPHHSVSYQRRVNSPLYFNFLLCCRPSGRSFSSVSHVRRTITDHKNLASWLERPDWRGGQLSSPVKRMQFTSRIFWESLSGCDLM